MVECQLPKLKVASSILVARSKKTEFFFAPAGNAGCNALISHSTTESRVPAGCSFDNSSKYKFFNGACGLVVSGEKKSSPGNRHSPRYIIQCSVEKGPVK
jgi:hypothetical protein